MYHFFISTDNIIENKILITGGDVNHIKNVLRMEIGDEILVSDGEGSDYRCKISQISDMQIICDINESMISVSEPNIEIYLFQGLPKSDKFETVIQKSVELGVHEIIPVLTERSVVRYDESKQKSKLERWKKISESAAKQSRRGIIPEVVDVMTFKEAFLYASGKVDEVSNFKSLELDKIFIPYENYKDIKTTKENINKVKPGMKIGIFIGPEGGFSNDEIEYAKSLDAIPISLGNRILRTETAPLMLLSVLIFQTEG